MRTHWLMRIMVAGLATGSFPAFVSASAKAGDPAPTSTTRPAYNRPDAMRMAGPGGGPDMAPGEPRGPGMGLGPGPGEGRDGRDRRIPQPSREEAEEIRNFMKEHAPNRFALFESLPANGPAKMRLMNRMTLRYRSLQRFREQDESVFILMVQRMELEDEVFGMLRDGKLKDAELNAKLREKVVRLVEIIFEERQKRIESLERSLEEEKKRLADDKASMDVAVERQMDAMKSGAEEVHRRFNPDFEGPRGPRERERERERERPPAEPSTRPSDRDREQRGGCDPVDDSFLDGLDKFQPVTAATAVIALGP